MLMSFSFLEKNKNSYMLLIGYTEKHKEMCKEEDCPLIMQKRKRFVGNIKEQSD